jgi:iron complex outermembrane receptor protein
MDDPEVQMAARQACCGHWRLVIPLGACLSQTQPALAQRADDNAVTAADDAFGTSIGNENVGIYNPEEVRGFSPVAAGNLRLGGLYLANVTLGNGRLQSAATVHVGLSAQGYPFPAPTGIVDFSLRPAGREPLLSAVAYAGVQTALEIDAQLPVGKTLSIAAGVSASRFLDAPDDDIADYYAVGIAPQWQPRPGIVVRPYFGRNYSPTDVSTPFTFVNGPHLPPNIPHRRLGQKWAAWENTFDSYGVIGTADLGQWRFGAGLFGRRNVNHKSYNTLFVGTEADGDSRFLVNIHPERLATSAAGEIRVTRRIDEGPRRHEFHLSARGRQAKGEFGGEAVVDFGPVVVGEITPDFAEPEVTFGPETRDKVRETTFGIAYHGRWAGVGELSLGLLKTRYRKTVSPPGAAAIVTRDDPWLWNGTLAVNLARGLVAYAGYTKGLEDSFIAPEIAVNRSEAPPALRTSQRDAGIRWAFGRNMRLVAGLFDVRKPYFNLDPQLFYTQLGTVRHRGVELSLTGEPLKGLNLLVGAVLMKPRVTGEAVDLGLIGGKPVAQPERQIRANFDYRPPGLQALSVDVGVNHLGDRPGGADNRLTVPGRTLVDLGARYRLRFASFPATLRVQITNLFDDYAWNVTGAGGFRRVPPRRVQTSLAVDF